MELNSIKKKLVRNRERRRKIFIQRKINLIIFFCHTEDHILADIFNQ